MEILSNSYKLGFGCASLTSLNNRKLSLSLLEHTYNEGITHFDVARLYGMGNAENIVGEFSKGKRDKITITSKFGLNPPSLAVNNRKFTRVIKNVLKQIPSIQKKVQKKLFSKVTGNFSIKNANNSLEKSLKELNTDYIDYYLLHEATMSDANSDELINFLEDKKKEGKIIKYGLGTNYKNIGNDCNLFDRHYEVFQFQNNVFHPNLLTLKNKETKFIITHSALEKIDMINQNLNNVDYNLFNNEIDISSHNYIAPLLLFYSCKNNPEGITLFSSTKKENISNNLALLNKINKNLSSKKVRDFFKTLAIQ